MNYFIRKSHFSLVELSILAHSFESTKSPLVDNAIVDQKNVTETLLQMKASEKQGGLFVAVYESDPVGFIWDRKDGSLPVMWVHPEHSKSDLASQLAAQLS